ncbi:hypothetical protein RHMOL_Rhmol01G0230900 [Rhododendron molle]|uniref:Uncharacterized protein n=1 Tax=Rhododendron molle TaxID=49168 RepID=A0ACC0Q4T8_RHOML|nr:hypothetical protein RHMOL_Rhmol01G0230900 [Rhododendron molle]
MARLPDEASKAIVPHAEAVTPISSVPSGNTRKRKAKAIMDTKVETRAKALKTISRQKTFNSSSSTEKPKKKKGTKIVDAFEEESSSKSSQIHKSSFSVGETVDTELAIDQFEFGDTSVSDPLDQPDMQDNPLFQENPLLQDDYSLMQSYEGTDLHQQEEARNDVDTTRLMDTTILEGCHVTPSTLNEKTAIKGPLEGLIHVEGIHTIPNQDEDVASSPTGNQVAQTALEPVINTPIPLAIAVNPAVEASLRSVNKVGTKPIGIENSVQAKSLSDSLDHLMEEIKSISQAF